MDAKSWQRTDNRTTHADMRCEVSWGVLERPLRVVEHGALVSGVERRVEQDPFPPGAVLAQRHLTPPERPSLVNLRGLVVGPGGELVSFTTSRVVVEGRPIAPSEWRLALFRTPTEDGTSVHEARIPPADVQATLVDVVEAWELALSWSWRDVVAAFGDDLVTEGPIRRAAVAFVLASLDALPVTARVAHALVVADRGALPGFDPARAGIGGLDLMRERIAEYVLGEVPFAEVREVVERLTPTAAPEPDPVAPAGDPPAADHPAAAAVFEASSIASRAAALAAEGVPQREIARRLGTSPASVNRVLRRVSSTRTDAPAVAGER